MLIYAIFNKINIKKISYIIYYNNNESIKY